ncbi:MAG: hypothetical protein WCF62_26325, partial [Pseudolabrys sp.]
MTMNFRWKKIAAIYQHALEPNVPPINFFGLLGDTNFLSTHGTSPRSFLNLAEATKVPGHPGPSLIGLGWATVGKGQPQKAPPEVA